MKGEITLCLLLILIVIALALSGAVDFDAMMGLPRPTCIGQCGPPYVSVP